MERSSPGALERFGVKVVDRWTGREHVSDVGGVSDDQRQAGFRRILRAGMVSCSLISVAFVFPIAYVDVATQFLVVEGRLTPLWHTLLTLATTLFCVAIELLVLLYLAMMLCVQLAFVLKLHQLLRLSSMVDDEAGLDDDSSSSFSSFSLARVLVRAALELDDPPVSLEGVDPFKQINKWNLLLLGLLYKAKIVLSNTAVKMVFFWLLPACDDGCRALGPIVCSFFVEIFWNCVVVWKVLREARLRLAGFSLAHHICQQVAQERRLQQLSHMSSRACLRGIACVMVMSKSYHTNLMILLLKFQNLIKIHQKHAKEEEEEEEDLEFPLDDWNYFVQIAQNVSEKERNFLLDVVTVAASFDGKFSAEEKCQLRLLYKEEYDVYAKRISQLIQYLQNGRIDEALQLCKLDFESG